MNTEYESIQEYTSDELKSIYDSLGLYVPSDIKTNAEIADYYLLFDTLRVLYTGYGVLNKEQVVEKFYDYYNAPLDKKNSILLELKNKVLDLNYEDNFESEVAVDETTETILKAYEIIRNQEGQNTKLHAAEFLYLIDNGHNPKPEEDISQYYKMVEQYDQELQADNENREQMLLALQAKIQPDLVPQYEALTPEEVAAKYLKGAGLVDPAARNSGFRVDRDVNFEE